mmetsp:Transcript_7734/g.17821  ORF Transcript_7734/g.17821 Transcript_7734/m.17821 type:complete len:204 (+) Transcript_7734:1157-1768(+)
MVRVEFNDLVGLVRQLTGGRNDEAERAFGWLHTSSELLLQSAHDHRQAEHQRLATAGEGNSDDVAAHQPSRDALHLNLSWPYNAFRLQTFEDAARKAHLLEALDRRRDISAIHLDEVLFSGGGSFALWHITVFLYGAPVTYGWHPFFVDNALGSLPDRHQRRAHLQLNLLEELVLFVLDALLECGLTGVLVCLLFGFQLGRNC